MLPTERQTVLDLLEQDLGWWRHSGRTATCTLPDLDATLCRIRTRRHDNRGKEVSAPTLSNMVLLRSRDGRLSAAILIDPGDRRGPRKSWPARALAALFQVSTLQDAIARSSLTALPDFVAILNPHDFPEQVSRTTSWAGLLPLISNSRVPEKHRDLLMPDYSFAPGAYMTHTLSPAASTSDNNRTQPRGWPYEYRAIDESGLRTGWADKQPSLFWRGGLTSPARLNYATNLSHGRIPMPSGVRVDVRLPCHGHCTSDDGGVPPEDWCRHQMLLSLPGTSFAVGFKYLLLCGSAVIRGHYDRKHPEYEQWCAPPNSAGAGGGHDRRQCEGLNFGLAHMPKHRPCVLTTRRTTLNPVRTAVPGIRPAQHI
jgi:hypothetical protein